MMFGLQGAPGVFQELMEILTGKAKQDEKTRKIISQGHLASFFDDTGLGTQTLDDHFYLLERYFQICKENQVRIKLSKCEFLQERMEYLGYELGWGWWRPSQKKVEPLMSSKVSSLKDLQRFLGALNFYRRHLKNFTFSSAPLTDLLKKTTPWRWTQVEEGFLEEIKLKLQKCTQIGTPNGKGEIIMVTDSSDVGGGATLFQWQSLEPQQLPLNCVTTSVNPDGSLKNS